MLCTVNVSNHATFPGSNPGTKASGQRVLVVTKNPCRFDLRVRRDIHANRGTS